MIWDLLTSEMLASVNRDTPVVLPLAATEQHGPHLPMATDRMIAEHFARQLHETMDKQVLILPTVSVGCSDHHMDFPGTLTLSHNVFKDQVNALITSVRHHGFKRILLLNSHGGNQAIGQVVIEELGSKYSDCHFVMATWWRIVNQELLEVTETGFGGVGHAGEFETSLMLLIAPELVVKEKMLKVDPAATYPWAQADMLRGSRAAYYRTMKQMTANGVFGDPTLASANKGERITQLVVDRLTEIVENLNHASK